MENRIDVKLVGEKFKKENIFLGTLVNPNSKVSQNLIEQVKERYPFFPEEVIVEMVNGLIREGAIEIKECDIFYKGENGYTSFSEEGTLTLKGDNSDGKGILKNIIPVWDYYNEDEVFEVTIDGETILSIQNGEPLAKYNEDYNLDKKGKRRRKHK